MAKINYGTPESNQILRTWVYGKRTEFQFSKYGAIALDWASWLINKLRNTLDRSGGKCTHNLYHFCLLGSWENNAVGSFERSEVAIESLHCGDCD